ncbi:MAG: tetratricopeptide repeat protein [Pseudomonadales bacterium]
MGGGILAERFSQERRVHNNSFEVFARELGRRKVIRSVIVYAIGCFVVLQLTDAVGDALPVVRNNLSYLLVLMIIGFPLVATLAWVFEVKPERDAADLEHGKLSRRSEMALLVAAFVICGAVAYLLFRTLVTDSQMSEPPQTAESSPPVIAVLPFTNLSADPEDRYLGDGLAEELIVALAKVEGLQVLAQNASFYFKNKDADWAEIVDRLRATLILEGSVRKVGDRVHVTAQLVDRNGHHIWAEGYPDLDFADLPGMQWAISQDVLMGLGLGSERGGLAASKPTEDIRAYTYYLQGKDYLRRPRSVTNLDSAQHLFVRALELDTGFIEAKIGLCDALLAMHRQTNQREDYLAANDACISVAAFGDQYPEALISIGNLNRAVGNYVEAERLFRRASLGLPYSTEARYGLARSLLAQGKNEQAMAELEKNLQVEPGNPNVYRQIGLVTASLGNPAQAAEYFAQESDLVPNNPTTLNNLGVAHFAADDWDSAKQAWLRAVKINATTTLLYNLGNIAYYEGRFVEALEYLDQALESLPDSYRYAGKRAAILRFVPGRTVDAQAAFQRASQLAQESLAVNSDDAHAWKYLSGYLANLDDLQGAENAIQQAQTLAPDDSETSYFYAIVQLRKGNQQAAADALQEAIARGYSRKLIAQDPQFSALRESGILQAG